MPNWPSTRRRKRRRPSRREYGAAHRAKRRALAPLVAGGAWHQLTAQTTEFTLADGADIDLRYNDAIGGYVDDGSDRPSTVNSGHYDIVVSRTK